MQWSRSTPTIPQVSVTTNPMPDSVESRVTALTASVNDAQVVESVLDAGVRVAVARYGTLVSLAGSFLLGSSRHTTHCGSALGSAGTAAKRLLGNTGSAVKRLPPSYRLCLSRRQPNACRACSNRYPRTACTYAPTGRWIGDSVPNDGV